MWAAHSMSVVLQVLSGEGALRDVERLYTRNQLGWESGLDGWFLSAQVCIYSYVCIYIYVL
jgi:hypothetical protein